MFKNKKKYFILVLLSVSLSVLSSCGLSQEELLTRAGQAAINATGAYLTPITVQDEIQLGQQMITQVNTQYKEYTASPELVAYVRSIGAKVVTQALRKNELNYQFYVLDSSEVNSFTIPGGAVFITSEILKYMNNESELAGVLAHEVGHNERDHIASSIRRTLVAQGVAEGALKQGDSAILQGIAGVTFDLILKGYDRGQEKEADETGTSIIAKLNYLPTGVAGLLKTLSNLTGGKDDSGIVELLQTHPGSLERIDNINAYISKNNITVTSPLINEDVYKRAVSVLPPKVALPGL